MCANERVICLFFDEGYYTFIPSCGIVLRIRAVLVNYQIAIMKPGLTLIIAFFAISIVQAQEEIQFDKGLAVANCHRYGREAIVTDHLAWLLTTGQLKKPVAEGKLITNEEGEDLVWNVIETDSTGRFRGNALSDGYVYLTHTTRRAGNALLNISGNSMVYVNGEPRGGDIYNDGWMNIPVKLRKGTNEILIRCGRFSRWQGVKATLRFSSKNILISTQDATLPHIVLGGEDQKLSGAVVITNNTDRTVTGLSFTATLNDKTTETRVGDLLPGTLRKTRFDFDGSGVTTKGDHACHISLKQNGKALDEQTINIAAVQPDEHHSYTFTSDIDGSLQYYSVAPQTGSPTDADALFLSVHGAGVEAIGQARAYKPKDWGVLVTPTNRRPRGFNWEDWGRMDALEVLALAKERFDPAPEKIYLTGHSMGGHGTWYLGATYPDKWAAIAPCAGYPTLTGYGSADGKIPDSARSESEKILLRASNASNVIDLAHNYKSLGVYVFHGDADRVVPVRYARQMREVLGKFHPDFSYNEYPGGSHWFGNESVDWAPIFDFFKWHTLKRDSAVDNIDFTTANPGISSTFRWASIIQQEEPLIYSKILLTRNKKEGTITGTTENVEMLKLDLDVFASGATVRLDGDSLKAAPGSGASYFVRKDGAWQTSSEPGPGQKNEKRAGTFKEAFNHRMVMVYGTRGNDQENKWAFNKARYDAEVWYYRGNGAVEIISDADFRPDRYADRGVILYGNANTNSAWSSLLANCPIQVTRDAIRAGDETFRGNDLAAYFTWPRPDSDIASVAVVTGTGLPGLRAADANQYFAAGAGFPDFMIFSAEMLKSGATGIKATGFYNNQWEITETTRD